jgi:hypothetical protein
MIIAIPRIRWAAVAAAVFAVSLPAIADEATAISTGGKGDLTMCSYGGCRLYHHIKLPPQIAVGGKMTLHFGSNPKRYRFPIVRIVRDGDMCTVFSQATETQDVEKVEIASCAPVPSAQ